MRKYRIPLPPPPKANYKLTLQPLNRVVEVEVDKLPYTRHGLPGSILDIVSHFEEGLIDHACGGVQACSTCHVYITKGVEKCNEVSEREEDKLDECPALKLNSRLACACVPDGSQDFEVTIPKWNKNEVKE